MRTALNARAVSRNDDWACSEEVGEVKRSFEHAVIRSTGTVRDALVSLDRSGCQVVLVTEDDRVIGLLTDGDLRRAMLRGASLDGPINAHYKRDFTFVGVGGSRVDVLDLMTARRISEVPILDDAKRLVGLHLLHDVVGRPSRPNTAVVMAGGRGTRLGALTDDVPKPMLRVAGRPILERIVLQLVGAGIRHIHLAINYLGHVVEEHFGDGRSFGCEISYLKEETPLGTGGALSLLEQIPEHPILVMNGDLVTQADLGALVDYHVANRSIATVGIRRYVHTVPFGCVEIRGNELIALHEKPSLSQIINAGLYVVEPELVRRAPRGKPYSMPDLLTHALEQRERVVVWEVGDDWIDVGKVEQLKVARGEGS